MTTTLEPCWTQGAHTAAAKAQQRPAPALHTTKRQHDNYSPTVLAAFEAGPAGKSWTYPMIVAACGLPDSVVRNAVRRLIEAGWIAQEALPKMTRGGSYRVMRLRAEPA